MNVVYVYQGEWPKGATRVAKQVNALSRSGHRVDLVCRNYGRARRVERWGDGDITVRRLPAFPLRLLNRIANFPLFLNPVWVWAVWTVARRSHADVLIVADLPLAPTVFWVGRMLGIPVHYDMAEVYPEFLKTLWSVGHMSALDHVVRSPRAAALLERYIVRRVRSLSVVSEESRDRAIAIGAKSDRIVLVGNTPENVRMLSTPQPVPEELARLGGRPRAVFVGTIIADRGVTESVEALRDVVDEIPNAALVIVGDGPDRPRLLRTIERLRLRDHVLFLGWREHHTLTAFYQHADVGLLPFLDTPHVRITMANKLFDYMAAGLPVLGSDLPPIRRVLEETRAGLLFPPGDHRTQARRLVELFRDPVRRRVLGVNGRQAVARKYSWKIDAAVLVERIEDLAGRRPGTPEAASLVGAGS